ncbi:MAG: hypothetical protein KDA31_15095 [Phycisphaerales bacterium]|nr:hypothetical protein [Phycisphaerales bacterium]
MNLGRTIIALSLLTAPSACTQAYTQPSDTEETPGRSSADSSDPMAGFAVMEAGEWRLGSIHADTWRWGPGKHSIRSHTVGDDGSGNPWREMAIYYWHPGLEQIRILSLHPDIPAVGRGIAEGAIEFDGRTLTGKADLYQTGRPTPNRRRLAHRWTFDGPDRYHEVLLENSGKGYETLVEWDYERSVDRSPPPRPDDEKPTISENLKPFIPLLGQWEDGDGKDASKQHSALNIQWVEYLDLITVQLDITSADDESVHLFDAYLYHHLGTNSLRCLALSKSGGVYEGEVALLLDGALECDLRGFVGELETLHVARLEFEGDGMLRERVWTVADGSRTLTLDARYRKSEPVRSDPTP